jgi:hypothetical protein
MASKAPGARSTPAAAPSEAPRVSDVSPRQERLLSEISHELGNYFHKLYYWAELLREQRPASADAEPPQLLEQTIRDLESFLKTALEYFRPISVVPMAMTVDDLTASLRALVTRHVEPGTVRWQVDVSRGAATVAVDPGRFSFVLDGLVRRLHAGEGAAVSATVQTSGSGATGTYVLTLAAPGTERAGSASVASTIEWAVIERLVELHGGTLALGHVGADRTVRLELPIRS